MIKGINLSKQYGDKKLFENLNIDLPQGGSLGIAGKNGAGKSTLINILVGQVSPDSGKVETSFSQKDTFKNIGIQFQNSSLDKLLKVKEIINEFMVLQKIPRSDVEHWIDLLDVVGLLNKRTTSLSFGEKQRINILLSIMNNPDYLFLDEVTTGLDYHNRQKIYKILKQIMVDNNKLSLVLVSHYDDELYNLCNDVLVLSDGKYNIYNDINHQEYANFKNNFDIWMR